MAEQIERSATDIAALVADLTDALGAGSVSVDPTARKVASTDWAHMSPVLSAKLPAGLADVVAYPTTPEQIATATHLAHRHGIPVTPRGQGTGNYGQGIPLRDGLVIDTSRCNRVLEVGDGWIRAEAGASFVALENAARQHNQEIAIMPSTVGSAIGGFLAGGSGGTGSVENGFIWDDYVHELRVAPCTDAPELVTVDGPAACRPHLHAYGVTGVLATVTVRLVPKRDWIGLLGSFDDEPSAVAAGRELMRLAPPPRILSIDEPAVVATLPADPAIPAGRFSLRAVLDRSVESVAGAIVSGHGGVVEQVRDNGAAYLASLSFNHLTYRARKARPDLCHLQVAGEAMITRGAELRAVLPETMVHFDGFLLDRAEGPGYVGMLLCRFENSEKLYAGMDRLRDLGLLVDDPHSWLLGGDLSTVRETAATFDPDGLLNPGKLPSTGPARSSRR
ncbi:MAG TPA: FAD-binding oxidoreductase [Pseudonocardiaceae bacterium]|nr:FAD-binding oxidoreductase [Pseudonocardiaceae bacterium]